MELKNLKVIEFTSICSETAKPDTALKDIESTFKEFKIRHIPVVDNGKPVGIITERDVYRYKSDHQNIDNIFAKDIMQSEPYIVNASEDISEVAFEMSRKKIGSVLVEDPDDDFLGIFTSTDALNALVEFLRGDIDKIR